MNYYFIILVIAIILGVTSMSWSYLKSIGKSFQNSQPPASEQRMSLQEQQKRQAQEAEAQRRAYMDTVQQRIRDSRQR